MRPHVCSQVKCACVHWGAQHSSPLQRNSWNDWGKATEYSMLPRHRAITTSRAKVAFALSLYISLPLFLSLYMSLYISVLVFGERERGQERRIVTGRWRERREEKRREEKRREEKRREGSGFRHQHMYVMEWNGMECMYLCMSVCLSVCMYACICMHACMLACMYVCRYVWP